MRPVVVPIALLAAASWVALTGCSKPAPPPCTCRQLQELVTRCAPQSLALVRARLKAAGAGAAVDDSEQQYRMFELRYKKKLKSELALAQCERYRTDPSDDHKGQLARMTACCAKPDCDAFAACHLGL